MKQLTDTFTFHNGYEIPCVGFGTWQTPDGNTAVSSVKTAISAGYRHIDTAAAYGNEKSVGKAIRESGIKREDLFITSKVWNDMRGYEKTMQAFAQTMEELGLDYLDLYLIHWPASASRFDNWEELNTGTWRAMTELYKAGKIKAIGVSNFLVHHLEPLMKTEVKPMVNQIEFHPGQMQEELVKYCRDHEILVEAWSPLGTGKMLNNAVLMDIAKKYGKSTAQICIRWCLQHDILPLPKSVTPERIEENANVFDFILAADDMKTIDEIPYFGGSGLNPDEVKF